MTTTASRILSAVATYRAKFKELKIGKMNIPENEKAFHIVQKTARLAFCNHLLDDVERAVSEGMTATAGQWLGLVQGMLVSDHVYTFKEIERHGIPAAA